jgi:hypothetical protein
MACHINLQFELNDSTALHGILKADQTTLNCRACHPEHRGPSAQLTELDLKSFPHEKLGFALNTHLQKADGSPLLCADCHTSDYRVFEMIVCNDCHAQMDKAFTVAHTLGFGFDCIACHDGLESYGKNVDHTQMAFILTGKHLNLACTACHLNARNLFDLETTPQDCEACHLKDDAHQARFGANCGVCHSPDGWKPAKFDHNLADFKLTGKHIDIECKECHQDDVYSSTPDQCGQCHAQDDEHNGRFGLDCGLCHSTAAWEPASFDHALAKFQLTGAHINVACEKCHINGQYCHTTTAWRPAPYNGPHIFPMNHGDAKTCADCHLPTLTTWTCYTCHNQGEMISKHSEKGIGNFDNCLECHPTGHEGEGGGGND